MVSQPERPSRLISPISDSSDMAGNEESRLGGGIFHAERACVSDGAKVVRLIAAGVS
jgi:hypothetical protein